jgi:hypothetical protein
VAALHFVEQKISLAWQIGKRVQMRAYGAEIELIPGTRRDTADAAVRHIGREPFQP